MAQRQNQNHDLMMMCNPYLFALKEGQKISNDFFDYSLLLMQRSCAEIVKAPSTMTRGVMMVDLRPSVIRGRKETTL